MSTAVDTTISDIENKMIACIASQFMVVDSNGNFNPYEDHRMRIARKYIDEKRKLSDIAKEQLRNQFIECNENIKIILGI